MIEKNTYGKRQYVTAHLIWGGIAFLWYSRTLFCSLEPYSFGTSRLILMAVVAVVSIVGIVPTMKHQRNGENVFFHLMMGYGCYTAVTYIHIRRTLVLGCCIGAAVLSALCAYNVLSRPVRSRRRAREVLRARAGYVAGVSGRYAGMACCAMIGALVFNLLLGDSLVAAKVKPAAKENLSQYTIAKQIDTVALFEETAWCDLSVEERLDALQTIANIEQRYLGIPHGLKVGAANLGENTLGHYNDTTHEIIIDLDTLLHNSSSKVLETVCHEAYHAYQHRMVDVYSELTDDQKNLRLFKDASSYEEEFANYIDGDDNPLDYFLQDCETDARNYAEEAVEDYWCRIKEYLYGDDDEDEYSDSDGDDCDDESDDGGLAPA